MPVFYLFSPAATIRRSILSSLNMKTILLACIAAVLFIGCGKSNDSSYRLELTLKGKIYTFVPENCYVGGTGDFRRVVINARDAKTQSTFEMAGNGPKNFKGTYYMNHTEPYPYIMIGLKITIKGDENAGTYYVPRDGDLPFTIDSQGFGFMIGHFSGNVFDPTTGGLTAVEKGMFRVTFRKT